MYRKIIVLLAVFMLFTLPACSNNNDKVVIYTSSDENEIEIMEKMLTGKFPDYQIMIEYLPTGNHAARLKAEGLNTECDISYDLEYGYLEMLEKEGIFENISTYDTTKYMPDLTVSDYYIPTLRYGGAVIVNNDVLSEKGLDVPATYQDLLKPEYKGLISMPNPSSSGTGYMFLKSLVNAWGSEDAFHYFDQLSVNILQFTSSGSGPVNALEKKEAAIGLGMTSHAALKMTEGQNLGILFFSEGSPYTACGSAIMKGKSSKPAVSEVFTYLYTDVTAEIARQLYPEPIYKDIKIEMPNYPLNIPYADMSNDNAAEKERLLAQWKY